MKKHITKILFYWLLIALITPNILLSCTEPLSAVARVANILLPLGVLGLIISLSRNLGRTILLLIPYFFFAAFQVVLLSLYGNGIISVDMFLNVVTTNTSEAWELLSRMWPILIVVCVLYVIPILWGVYCTYAGVRVGNDFLRQHRTVFITIASIGVMSVAVCYGEEREYSLRTDLYPANIGYNLYLSGERYGQMRNYAQTSADYDCAATSTHTDADREIYILVIGETSRAHNWQLLGYNRPTNPELSKRTDLIAAKNAYSESNTTHKSVPMMLSSVNSRTFDSALYKTKSLISAFRQSGFHTTFISNQLPNHSYIDFFANEADSVIFVKLIEETALDKTDSNVLPYVERCLADAHQKQLIVIHSYGSHFNYRDRYNDADRVFLPDDYTKTSRQYRTELVNAYDNTIVATDRFLSTLITNLERRHCVAGLIYASDHGEDIFDDGSDRCLHASPTPSEYQLHVPFIAWLSSEYRELYPDTYDTLRRNFSKMVSVSNSYYATALSIGGVRTKMSDVCDDLASTSYTSKDIYYLNDHNEPLFVKACDDQATHGLQARRN